MAHHVNLGRWGEQLAAAYLEALGFALIERNWRHSSGEIDLVVRGGRLLVFVEVKTRSSLDCGHPFEALTPVKCARLYRLAQAWRADHTERGPFRIDAVAVTLGRSQAASIEHLESVFS